MPGSNLSYWSEKLARNTRRDLTHLRALEQLGWKVFTVWECELKDLQNVTSRLETFLDRGSQQH